MLATILKLNTFITLVVTLASAKPLPRPQPSPRPNCLADVIYANGLERRELLRREEGLAFGYEGSDGPNTWVPTETCQAGKFQSPINFVGEDLLAASIPQIDWPAKLQVPIEMVNNGHTVQVNMPKDQLSLLSTRQIDGKNYTLQQFHFHSPSEHHIDGKFFPLEVHFVHMSADNKINVVGAMFDFTTEGNPFLCEIEHAFPQKADTSTTLGRLDLSFVKDSLAASDFFTYSGSLTTPPCTEGVLWTFAQDPMPISMDQFKKVQEAIKFNARLVQNNQGAAEKSAKAPPAAP
ncbi:hypothetical protein HDU67_002007, partial [Dinochytrium kinnereticum]